MSSETLHKVLREKLISTVKPGGGTLLRTYHNLHRSGNVGKEKPCATRHQFRSAFVHTMSLELSINTCSRSFLLAPRTLFETLPAALVGFRGVGGAVSY